MAEDVDVSEGLHRALGGMASAFITTLFGAVLGGVILTILCNCTDVLTEELVDRIEQIAELRVIPQLRVRPEDLLRKQIQTFEQCAQHVQTVAAKELERLAAVSGSLPQRNGNSPQCAHSANYSATAGCESAEFSATKALS